MQEIIIGSRGSDLALWQAHFVQDQLKNLGYSSQIKIIVTKGDRIQHLSFDKIEGKGFFTKEIEEALLAGEIDLAVHSLKDLPTTSPDGLTIGATSYREDPRDLLLIRPEAHDPSAPLGLAAGAVVGTSSARRKVQVRLLQSDVVLKDLRGNVPTRIQKCRDGQYDAILLAAAGVSRLQLPLSDFVAIYLDAQKFVPAPAQGVLGLQIRANDERMTQVAEALHQKEVATAVSIERKTLHLFEGGCHMPVGAHCIATDRGFELTVIKSTEDAQLPIKIRVEGKSPDELAQSAVAMANKARAGRVFISRNRVDCEPLAAQLEAHGYEVVTKALLATRQVTITALPPADWLFFVSRNAVHHFFQQQPPMGNVKIAAVGEGTARALAAVGRKVDFTGEGNDLLQIAHQFTQLAQGNRVLFPIGNKSKRTIQEAVQSHCALTEMVVYENMLQPHAVDGPLDAVVLTSPSSVEAFLQSNQVAAETLIVGMGPSTVAKAKDLGGKRVVASFGFRQDELAMTLFSHL